MQHRRAQANRTTGRTPLRRCLAGLRLAASEDGQAVAELALVLPLLLLLIFGIIQFARATNASNDSTHLANEVARYAVVNEDPLCPKGSTCVRSMTTGLAAWGKKQFEDEELVKKTQEVCIRFPIDASTGTSGQVGDPVEVVTKATITWLPMLKLKVISSGLGGKAVMRLEAPPTVYGEECA